MFQTLIPSLCEFKIPSHFTDFITDPPLISRIPPQFINLNSDPLPPLHLPSMKIEPFSFCKFQN